MNRALLERAEADYEPDLVVHVRDSENACPECETGVVIERGSELDPENRTYQCTSCRFGG